MERQLFFFFFCSQVFRLYLRLFKTLFYNFMLSIDYMFSAFQNPCSLGNPQLTQDGRPLACSAAQDTCSSTYWCHFGAIPQTTVCCPGRGYHSHYADKNQLDLFNAYLKALFKIVLFCKNCISIML